MSMRPMSEAPKDGTPVLVKIKDDLSPGGASPAASVAPIGSRAFTPSCGAGAISWDGALLRRSGAGASLTNGWTAGGRFRSSKGGSVSYKVTNAGRAVIAASFQNRRYF
ncbi:hypothetical protein MACH18_12570 [Phaeobacter italicus]|nr:hypothetical protein MACH18_12570 [Phaeobacter italicus]